VRRAPAPLRCRLAHVMAHRKPVQCRIVSRATQRSHRHPPAAPRSHSKRVTSRPSREGGSGAPQYCLRPVETRITRVISVTARAGNTRAQSPAAAQAGVRPERLGQVAVALGNNIPTSSSKASSGWTGFTSFAGIRVKRGSSPRAERCSGFTARIDERPSRSDTHKAVGELKRSALSGCQTNGLWVS